MMLIRVTPYYKNKLSFLGISGHTLSHLRVSMCLLLFFIPVSLLLSQQFFWPPGKCQWALSFADLYYQMIEFCKGRTVKIAGKKKKKKSFHPLKVKLIEHDLQQNIVGTFVRQTATFHVQMGILGLNCYLWVLNLERY